VDKEMGKKYVTSWERMALHKGKLETSRAHINTVLEIRFGAVPAEISDLINHINDLETLEELHRQAVQCTSLEAFAEHLPVVA
jgi:hypothetical protein